MTTVDLSQLYGPDGPHKYQLEAHVSTAKIKCLKWARRGGKGRTAVNCLIDTYFQLVDAPPRPKTLVPQFHAGFIAPFTRNADQAWMELKEFIPEEVKEKTIEDEHKIWLRSFGNVKTGLIEFRTADNESALQGWGLDFCWITESQDVGLDAYMKLRPALHSPGRLGILFAEGVPPLEPDHWFNVLFNRGQEREPGHFSSRLTYLQNPMLSEEDRREIEEDRETMTEEEWRRMYLAEDPSGMNIPMDIERVMTQPVDWEKQIPYENHEHVMGLDLGQHISATVITIWDKTVYPWQMVYFRRMKGTDWAVQKVAISEVAQKWHAQRIYMDANGVGNPIYDDLRYAGLPVEAVPLQGNTRNNLLTKLAIVIEKGAIRVPREEQIVRECRAMQRVRVSPLNQRWQARKGYPDDCVFSMALGITDLPLKDGPSRPRKTADFYGFAYAGGIGTAA